MTLDIVQEVYLLIFKHINSLKDDTLFIAWLNKITYNTTIKELKKSKKQPVITADEDIELKLVDHNNPLTKSIDNESIKELMESILSLKEKYRTVLILKYLNNYKIKEIAQIIDCPEGTVKSRLNAAKSALKEELYKKHNKTIVVLGFGIMISSALSKTAQASVIGNSRKSISTVANSYIEALIKKCFLMFVVIVATVVPTTIFKLNENHKIMLEKVIEVSFDTAFTNKNVEVKAKINNLDKNSNIIVLSPSKENISINVTNDILLFTAKSNGTYLIISKENGTEKIIKEVYVNNIDREAPIIAETNRSGDTLDLVLFDNLSGINYRNIELITEDSTKREILNIDQSKNKISIKLSEENLYLKLFDNAGNLSINNINIEYLTGF